MVTAPKLDKKFAGTLTKVKNDTVVPADQWVVFLAKDNAFAAVLPMYLAQCRALKCDDEQIMAVERLVADVFRWRVEHPELCKDPDARGERMIGR